MKHTNHYKTVGAAAVCTVLFLAACVKPTTSHCPVEEPSDSRRDVSHPVKVVVQPWFGRHHVYGVFMVPARYRDENRYRTTMNIRGADGQFVVGEGGEQVLGGDIVIEEGRYAKQMYIPTRVALWALVTGQFGDLRTPCNWTLEFVKRSP